MIKEFAIDLLPAVLLILHFLDKWYLSKGKLWPVYVLAIFGSVCGIIFNYLLYESLDGEHKSILLFSINSFWTTMMSIKGIARLVGHKKQNNNVGC